MIHPFLPDEQRKFLTVSSGVPQCLQMPLSGVRANAAIGTFAASMVTEAIRCILVGMFTEARQLLEKAREWFQISFAEREIPKHNYFPHGTEAGNYADFAQCRWLLEGIHDSGALQCCVKENNMYYLPNRERSKGGVELTLPSYIDAEAYEEAITLFESTWRDKRPQNPQSATRQAPVCYVIAKHRLKQDYLDIEVNLLLKRFLARNIPEMLGSSGWTDAARWMKIAHWKPYSDPIAALLRCYDYLPGLTPPVYPGRVQ